MSLGAEGVMVLAMAERIRPLRLNAGCGLAYRDGYVNFDLNHREARIDLAADIRALPFSPGCVDEVLLSHVLEHMGKHETLPALFEARRVLRVGGTIELEVPDLDYCLRRWLSTPDPHRWGFPLDAIYGDQTHPGQFHKTGFTRARLSELVERAGFLVEKVTDGTSHGVQVIRLLARRPPQFESRSDLVPVLRLEDERGLGRGWWALERGPGGAFRWTAGEAMAYLRAPAPGRWRLRLTGHAVLDHISGSKLTLYMICDSREVAQMKVVASGPVACEGDLAGMCAAEEFHCVQLNVTPAFYVPGDDRQLGITVRELSLFQ